MKTLNALVFSVALLAYLGAPAQHMSVDSVTHLAEVVIEERRLDEFNIGHYLVQPDTTIMQLASFGTLADLTRKFGFGHFRAYGPSGLATPSLRGTGASHTTILWNGINLQSSLNGTVDMSLLPAFLIDELEIQSGGSASLYGSGSIGGNIHLNNKIRFNLGTLVHASATLGSFGHHFTGIGYGWSGKKFSTSTKLFYLTARNDFPYVDRSVTPPVDTRRDHSAAKQYGLLQENAWQVNRRHLLTLRLWLQDNDVQVPNPSTITRPSQADQEDRSLRSALSWHYTGNRLQLLWQSAYAHYLVNYNDPVASINSAGIYNNVVNFIESTLPLTNRFEFTSGVNHTWEQGSIREYGSSQPSRHRVALYGAVKYHTHKLNTVLSAREEIVDGVVVKPAGSLSVDYGLRRRVFVFGNASHSYRVPTFNDLYWIGAGAQGNRSLDTENAWSQEAGIRIRSDSSAWSLHAQAALYNNNVDNWIQWTPLAQGWTPVNLKKVWSRGIESSFKLHGRHSAAWRSSLHALYTFNKSTNVEVNASANTGELGKQLFFTPVHEASVTATTHYRRWSLTVTETFTGKQYTEGSNNEFLAMKPFYVLSLWASYNVAARRMHSRLFAEVNNLLNHEYESRPGYPMPGINFKVGLIVKLKNQ